MTPGPAAGSYNEASPDSLSIFTSDIPPGLYDSNSSESTASSPMTCNGYDGIYGGNSFITYPTFPMQFPLTGDSLAQMGMIPVELDIKGLYEDHDRRRKSGGDKVVSSHVHSRRRAQNRASQRAFRDRKEKHMRELETRLNELEGRHNELSRSYESLQAEYSSVKGELDRLRKENDRLEGGSNRVREYTTEPKEWDESKMDNLDPLLFDVSVFCYEEEGDGKQQV